MGRRQIFVRFIGCNLDCLYCDTQVESTDGNCFLEKVPGSGEFIQIPIPVDFTEVTEHIKKWCTGWQGLHHSISVTGGEPLLHGELLGNWLPALKKLLPIHLETNGLLYEPLSTIIQHIDHISMDIKLPSTSGENDLWEAHQRFISLARNIDCSVKIVVNAKTEKSEVERAAGIVAEADRNIPFIIQPETGENLNLRIAPLQLMALQETALTKLSDVRVIPQMHKFLGVL